MSSFLKIAVKIASPPVPAWRQFNGAVGTTALNGDHVPYDIANMKLAVENVANKTLEIISKNEISKWAQKADLFPESINNEK